VDGHVREAGEDQAVATVGDVKRRYFLVEGGSCTAMVGHQYPEPLADGAFVIEHFDLDQIRVLVREATQDRTPGVEIPDDVVESFIAGVSRRELYQMIYGGPLPVWLGEPSCDWRYPHEL
jgi:hypothetical protein